MIKIAADASETAGTRVVPRDFDKEIARQVKSLLAEYDYDQPVRICSSANGGLRAGVLCASERFSGMAARNLAYAAGCNVVYTKKFSDTVEKLPPVDVLICVGGLQNKPHDTLFKHLQDYDLSQHSYQVLIWGLPEELMSTLDLGLNSVVIVDSVLDDNLRVGSNELLHVIQSLYLKDLVQKEGVQELQDISETPIFPTPAVVNLAHRSIANRQIDILYPTPFLIIDAGGATTDVHFGIELYGQKVHPIDESFPDDCRWVFTDLGVYASRQTTIDRLLNHRRLLDFIYVVGGGRIHNDLEEIRNGHVGIDVLFYGCVFLALWDLSDEATEPVPTLSLERVNAYVISGGASQCCNRDIVANLISMITEKPACTERVILDETYSLWATGIREVPLTGAI